MRRVSACVPHRAARCLLLAFLRGCPGAGFRRAGSRMVAPRLPAQSSQEQLSSRAVQGQHAASGGAGGRADGSSPRANCARTKDYLRGPQRDALACRAPAARSLVVHPAPAYTDTRPGPCAALLLRASGCSALVALVPPSVSPRDESLRPGNEAASFIMASAKPVTPPTAGGDVQIAFFPRLPYAVTNMTNDSRRHSEASGPQHCDVVRPRGNGVGTHAEKIGIRLPRAAPACLQLPRWQQRESGVAQ